MAEDTGRDDEPKPSPGYIPRPPTQADLDLVSGEQGMIADDWTGEPAGQPAQGNEAQGSQAQGSQGDQVRDRAAERAAEEDPEQQPG